MNIKPFGDRLLLKLVDNQDQETQSGIVLPGDISGLRNDQGTIVDIGGGEKISKLSFKVGMDIIFKRYGGEEIKSEDTKEKYLIVDLEEIIGYINNN
jgi:chaperonin GroES